MAIRTVYVGKPEVDHDNSPAPGPNSAGNWRWRYFYALDVQDKKGGRLREISRGYFSAPDGLGYTRRKLGPIVKEIFAADRVRWMR